MPKVSDIETTQMRVSWSPPDFDGGSPIIGYLVEYKAITCTKWTKVNKKSTDTTIRVNNMDEKTKYQFRISAENQFGMGRYSTPSDWYMTIGR